MDFEKLFRQSGLVKNDHYFKRYIKFIEYRKHNKPTGYVEKHHILPVSLFPSFKSSQDNIVVLRGREHYLIHYLIAKFTDNVKMWFAFNQMKRIGGDSLLYELCRQKIAECLSLIRKGKKLSKEHIKKLPLFRKNKIMVKDENGKRFLVDKNDSRYLSGELKHNRLGYKHLESTTLKISRNGTGGKLKCIDRKSNKRIFVEKENFCIDKHVEIVYPTTEIAKMSKTIKELNFQWFHDPISKVNLRLKNNEQPPGNYIKGRYFERNLGFEKANRLVNVVNLKIGKVEKVKVVDKRIHAPQSGQSTVKTIIFEYDNYIFTSFKQLNDYLENVNIFIDRVSSKEEFYSAFIKKPHHNNRTDIRKFREKYQNYKFEQLGISCYNLKEYVLKEEMQIWWN